MDVSKKSFQMSLDANEDDIKTEIPGNILLAEDNPINQKVVSLMLERAGYFITTVENGKAAVERYISAPDDYSMILMDIQMPVLNGINATRAIRQWEAEQSVPAEVPSGAMPRHISIVAVTAGAESHEKSWYVQAGMDDLLLKPIRREVLLTVIEKWMNSNVKTKELFKR